MEGRGPESISACFMVSSNVTHGNVAGVKGFREMEGRGKGVVVEGIYIGVP